MIYNLPRKNATSEETWLLNESVNIESFFGYGEGGVKSFDIQFTSNGSSFSKITFERGVN